MELIRKLETIEQTPVALLSEAEALDVFNLLKIGKSINVVKHELLLPTSKINLLNLRLASLRTLMERIVLGIEVKTEEVSHFDEETGEIIIDEVATYYDVPVTLNDLQNTTLIVINSKSVYGMGEGIFQAESIESMIASFYYVMEEIIKCSNFSNDATFAWWKDKITECK